MKRPSLPIRTELVCDIVAGDSETETAIAQIARVCAQDVRQPLIVRSRTDKNVNATILTLYLPAALAAGQTSVWCLACHLACFCPDAKVGVLVQAVPEFTQRRSRPAGPRERARTAA